VGWKKESIQLNERSDKDDISNYNIGIGRQFSFCFFFVSNKIQIHQSFFPLNSQEKLLGLPTKLEQAPMLRLSHLGRN
jgi:hypothetical protein